MHAMSREELQALMENPDADFVLINVLGRDQFAHQHIPNSINIPLISPTFARHVEEANGGKDRTVVVYCASFDCDASAKAATELEAEGFTSVYDYEGGTKDWFEAGNSP